MCFFRQFSTTGIEYVHLVNNSHHINTDEATNCLCVGIPFVSLLLVVTIAENI